MHTAEKRDLAKQCDELQLVEMTLDHDEWMIAEAGALMYMEQGISQESKVIDGIGSGKRWFEKLLGLGKVKEADQKLLVNQYVNKSKDSRKIAFSAPDSGMILPIVLEASMNLIVCQVDAFICADIGVSINRIVQKRFGVGLFEDNEFAMEYIHGDGKIYIQSNGGVVKRHIAQGETLRVDSRSLLAMTGQMDFDVQKKLEMSLQMAKVLRIIHQYQGQAQCGYKRKKIYQA